jgi:hypothetical protein
MRNFYKRRIYDFKEEIAGGVVATFRHPQSEIEIFIFFGKFQK